MSIYKDPARYARTVRITERLARIWCDHQLKLKAEVERASICPKCGKSSLEWQLGSYEEGTQDYIYCSNYEVDCGYVSEVKKEHEPLAHWYTFDHLLALNCGSMDGVKEYGGLQDWFSYAKKDIEQILK